MPKKLSRKKIRKISKRYSNKRGGSRGITSRLRTGLHGIKSIGRRFTGQPNNTSDNNDFIYIDKFNNLNENDFKEGKDIIDEIQQKRIDTQSNLLKLMKDFKISKKQMAEYLSKNPSNLEVFKRPEDLKNPFNILRVFIYSMARSISYLDIEDTSKELSRRTLNNFIKGLVESENLSLATQNINKIIMDSNRDQLELKEQFLTYNRLNAAEKMKTAMKNTQKMMKRAERTVRTVPTFAPANNVNQNEVSALLDEVSHEGRMQDFETRLAALRGNSRGGYRNKKSRKSKKIKNSRKRVYA